MNEEKQIPVSDGNEASLDNEDALRSEELDAATDADPGSEGGEPKAEVAEAEDVEVAQEADGPDIASAEAAEAEVTRESAAADKIQKLEEKLAAMHDRLLRTAAELDNVRKRSRREIEEAAIKGRSDVLREILPVIDSIDLALSSADPEGSAAAIVEGVEMVRRQFFSATERFHLKSVETVGKAFDPNFHEAVAQIPSPDFAAGQVVEEMRKGYVLGDRLLRAAMVVVSAGAPRLEEEASSQSEENSSQSEENPSQPEENTSLSEEDKNTTAEGHDVQKTVDQPEEATEASSDNAGNAAEQAEKSVTLGDGDG